MNTRTKTGLEILQIAVVLGVLGDVLLRQTPWGLNVLLFNLAFATGLLVLLMRHAPERVTKQTYAMLGALVFFASMFVWRDSIQLRVADTFAIIVILGVLFLPTLKVTAQIGGVFQYAVSTVWAGINSVFAPGALLGADIKWGSLPMSGWKKHAFAVFRALLVATPLILIFGALFMAADAVYAGWVNATFNIDFEKFISHLLLLSVFAWLTAGYFRGILFAGVPVPAEAGASLSIIPDETKKEEEASPMAKVRADSGEHPVTLPNDATVLEHINISDPPADAEARTSVRALDGPQNKDNASKKTTWSWADINNSIVPGFTLGAVEIGVILGLVNLLFLSFVIFQIPYLFGGMDLVQNTPDFKLAEYARRGFGELVAVSALVLPLLLLGHWLIRKEDRLAGTLFKVLAGVQIALLFVIMASAAQRLVLLTGNLGYGMTTVRLYPMIFMTWLAIVFILFAATVLRGARQYFAWAALWSAFLVLGATHVLNPDAFIVRTNIALMQQGREFDADYNSTELSDDAIPDLINAFESYSAEDAQDVVLNLESRRCRPNGEGDLRSFNISRYAAAESLRSVGLASLPEESCVNKWHD